MGLSDDDYTVAEQAYSECRYDGGVCERNKIRQWLSKPGMHQGTEGSVYVSQLLSAYERVLDFVKDAASSVPSPGTEHWELQENACRLLRDLETNGDSE